MLCEWKFQIEREGRRERERHGIEYGNLLGRVGSVISFIES